MLQHDDHRPAPQSRAPLTSRDANSSSTYTLDNARDLDSRKRSFKTSVEHKWLEQNIAVRACQLDELSQPHTLEPLLMLTRAQLPLAFLDPTSGLPRHFKTHLVSASIPSLDEDGSSREQRHLGPNILIARFLGEDFLCAVEKVHSNTYAICRLGSWITLEILRSLRPPSAACPVESTRCARVDPPHWRTAGTSEKHQIDGCRKRRKLAEPTPVKELADPKITEEVHNSPEKSFPPPNVSEVQDAPTKQDNSGASPPMPEEIFSSLVTQYLEFLYISRTSLAFFAKGPLSRARASIFSWNDPSKLVSFIELLRSMIIDIPVMNKKYQERLPSRIKAISESSPVGQTDDLGSGKALKPGRRKKLKLSKDGFYPLEDELVKAWWLRDDFSTSNALEHVNDEAMKKRLTALRFRETLLQTILVLEIQAIEIMSQQDLHVTNSTNHDKISIDGADKKSDTPKSKRKKDLGLCLDILVDRLCIWQSINNSETEDQPLVGASGAPHLTELHESNQIDSVYQLQEFCTEVVIPFFASRIFEQAYRISRKLGGPRQPSSAKRTRDRASSNRLDTSPGTVRGLKAGSKTRRPLQRVATDEEIDPTKRRPQLSRLSTISSASETKRELSATPLTDLASKDTKRKLSRSNSISKSKRFSQREVDVGAALKNNEIKIKKKLSVEQELKEAIANLKKPNRTSVVKDYFDSAERKPKQVQKTAQIQVNATPKRASKSLQLEYMTPHHAKPKEPKNEERIVPSSDLRVSSNKYNPLIADIVPNSVRPPSRKSDVVPVCIEVSETPTRGPTRPKSEFDSSMPPQTPIDDQDALINSTEDTSISNAATANKPCQDIMNAQSIYKSLGWEDDFDELA